MKPYEINPLADLTDTQLDELSSYNHHYTETNQQNILARFQKDRKNYSLSKPSKKLAVILVAALTIALVGFTSADRIQLLFYKYFGGARLEQYANDIGQSSSDQGFRMDVLTAISDGENTYLFVDLIDETGNRLSEDLYVDSCNMDAISKNLGENVASMYGIACRLVEYDPTTKTATLAVHATGNFQEKETKFTLVAFGSNKIEVKNTTLDVNLYELAYNNLTDFQPFDMNVLGSIVIGGARRMDFDDIVECLALDTLELRFPGFNLDYVSGIAFRDGYLHIQIKEAYNGKGKSISYILRNRKTGQILEPYYSLSYGLDQTQSATAPFVTGYPDYHTEYVYEVCDINNLKDYVFQLAEGEYYQNIFSGKWEVAFDAPEQMTAINISAGKSVQINAKEVFVKTISATPLGVTFVTQTAIESADGIYRVSVLFSDGKRYELNTETQMYVYENGEQEWQHTGAIMDFGKLLAIEINGVRFEVQKS